MMMMCGIDEFWTLPRIIDSGIPGSLASPIGHDEGHVVRLRRTVAGEVEQRHVRTRGEKDTQILQHRASLHWTLGSAGSGAALKIRRAVGIELKER